MGWQWLAWVCHDVLWLARVARRFLAPDIESHQSSTTSPTNRVVRLACVVAVERHVAAPDQLAERPSAPRRGSSCSVDPTSVTTAWVRCEVIVRVAGPAIVEEHVAVLASELVPRRLLILAKQGRARAG